MLLVSAPFSDSNIFAYSLGIETRLNYRLVGLKSDQSEKRGVGCVCVCHKQTHFSQSVVNTKKTTAHKESEQNKSNQGISTMQVKLYNKRSLQDRYFNARYVSH